MCTLCTRMSSFVGGFSNFQIMGRGPLKKTEDFFFGRFSAETSRKMSNENVVRVAKPLVLLSVMILEQIAK